jgi:hypothetical protein
MGVLPFFPFVPAGEGTGEGADGVAGVDGMDVDGWRRA